MTSKGPLEGRTALVTGAASGIGAATARAFARERAAVVLADVDATAGAKLAHEIREDGGRAVFVRCDVREERDIANAVERAVADFGGLHIAFNNAGVEGETADSAECTNENWIR